MDGAIKWLWSIEMQQTPYQPEGWDWDPDWEIELILYLKWKEENNYVISIIESVN